VVDEWAAALAEAGAEPGGTVDEADVVTEKSEEDKR
jgi:hypothetical protein